MVRVSAVWALFLLSLPAFAVDFGPPTRIPADPWTPPPFSYYQLTDPQAAASRNGYVAGWVDRAGLHYVRLDRQRQPLGPPQSLSPYSTTELIGIVTDGVSFGVAWRDGFGTIDANGNVRIAKLNEYLRAIAPFGNRFIALSHDALYRWSVITLDIEGNVLERAPFEPVYRAEEFYEFGGRLWLVRDTDRVPLTDAAGKLSPGAPEPLPIPANERTLAARMVGSRLYLITGAPGARTIVRELDPVSAAPVRTVATLPDRNDFVLTGEARGQLLVAFLTYGTRTIRVHAIGEDGSVAAADIAAPDVTQVAMVSDPAGASLFWIDHGVRTAQVRLKTPLASDGGVTLVAGERSLVSRVVTQQASLDGAAVGTNVVAVWEQPGANGTEIHASAIDAGGSAAGTPQFIMDGARPRIAGNGDIGLVVASGLRAPLAMRVDREGRALDPAPLTLPSHEAYYPNPVVLWDGAAFLVAYNAYYGIALVRIGAGGELLDSRVLRTASYPREIALLPTPEGYFVAWSAARAPAVPEFGDAIFVRVLSHTLEPVTEESLAAVCISGESGVLHPLLAWTESQFHLVWVKNENVRLIRFLADYVQVDSAFGVVLAKQSFSPERVLSIAGRPFLQRDGSLMQIRADPQRMSFALPAGVDKVAAIVNAADGRQLMLYTAVEEWDGYRIERAWVRPLH